MLLRPAKFFLAEFFIKFSFMCSELADFFHSLPLAFLAPGDLIELNNRHYAKDYILRAWELNAGNGFSPAEESFIGKYGFTGAHTLVIGCGAGREAIILAEKGFRVTGVDVSPGMIDAARKNAAVKELKIDFSRVSLYDIEKMGGPFDLVFLGSNYGMIPTRALRVQVLTKIKKILKPGATVFISFTTALPSKYAKLSHAFYTAIAYLILGNTKVEQGDHILGTGEFFHFFDSADAAIEEAEDARFFVEEHEKEENALFLKNTFCDA